MKRITVNHQSVFLHRPSNPGKLSLFSPRTVLWWRSISSSNPVMPKSSPWGGHRDYRPRGNTSVRASQSLQHKLLAEQQSSRCANTRNCSSSSSQSGCYLWQGEDKHSKVYLQRQRSVSRTTSSFISYASSSPVTLNVDPELPVFLAAENHHHKLLLQGQPSSAWGHLLHSVLPPNQGGSDTRRVIAATYAVPTRHSAWWFLATSVTCQSKLSWLASGHAGLSLTVPLANLLCFHSL